MHPFPTLQSSRLILRSLSTADAPTIFALFGSDEVTRYYDLATMVTESEAVGWIDTMTKRYEDGAGIRWAVCSANGGDLVGTCGLVWRPHNGSAILGYDILPDHWGKGYATEAAKLALDAAYDSVAPFEVNRIEAYTYPDNRASAAVLAKLGFSREGLLRQWGFWKDSYHDMECFAIIREDWQRENKSRRPTAPAAADRDR